jgi:hypothetical protein
MLSEKCGDWDTPVSVEGVECFEIGAVNGMTTKVHLADLERQLRLPSLRARKSVTRDLAF